MASTRRPGTGRWGRRPDRRIGLLAIAAALVLLAGAGPLPVAAVEPTGGEGAREVLAARMADVGVPGAALVVTTVDGSTVVDGLGRTGQGGPVTAQTPFVIGSTSKSVTALAVMQLVDEGVVDLDAPVRRYVPELQLAGDAAVDDITVRHVLQQTSGLPGTAGGPLLKAGREGSALDAVRELRDTSPTDVPGARWQYSNANYVLAGLVIERAAGVPYPEYVERRIFAPLGMDDSSATPDGAHQAGVSAGHRVWFGATVAVGPTIREGIVAAGFLVSTADDMGRYLRMYLRGGLADDGTRIVSPEGLRTLTAPGPEARLGSWADGEPVYYAMGWFVGGPWNEPALLHPGNTPDSSAMLTLLPARGTAVATLMNLSHEIPLPWNPSVTDRLSRNVVDAVVGEPADGGPSIRRFYLVLDLVALALVAAAGWGLVRAVGSQRRPRPRGGIPTATGVVVRLALVGVLAVLPGLLGHTWSSLWLWAPDLALVIGLLAVLLLATAVARAASLLDGRGGNGGVRSGTPEAEVVGTSP